MNIVVVGTSNSLRSEGYFPYLAADPRVTLAVNLSIGASTSLHTVESTSKCDFSHFDYALLEFAVNEEAILAGGGLDLDVVRGVVSNLIVRCMSCRCVPVIVIFPRLLKRGYDPTMRKFYLDLAKSYGIPFLDVYEIVEYIRTSSDITDFAIFKDSAHIERWICCAISQIVISGLQALVSRCDRFVSEPIEARGYASLPLVELVPGLADKSVTRSTSRSGAQFVAAVSSDSLELPSRGAKALVGVVVNLTETDCILEICAGESTLIDLRNVYYKNPNFRLIISSFPLPRRIEIEREFVALRPLDSAAAEGAVVSSAKKELGRIHRRAVGSLEISALLVELSEPVKSPVRTSKSVAVNILTERHHEILQMLCGIYRSLRSVDQDIISETQFRDRSKEKRERRKAAELMQH